MIGFPNPLLHNTPLKYHVFENIMGNGAFALFHNIFKSIQNLT